MPIAIRDSAAAALRREDTDVLARLLRRPRRTNGSRKTECFAKPKYCIAHGGLNHHQLIR
jgi:hypothetical protein